MTAQHNTLEKPRELWAKITAKNKSEDESLDPYNLSGKLHSWNAEELKPNTLIKAYISHGFTVGEWGFGSCTLQEQYSVRLTFRAVTFITAAVFHFVTWVLRQCTVFSLLTQGSLVSHIYHFICHLFLSKKKCQEELIKHPNQHDGLNCISQFDSRHNNLIVTTCKRLCPGGCALMTQVLLTLVWKRKILHASYFHLDHSEAKKR